MRATDPRKYEGALTEYRARKRKMRALRDAGASYAHIGIIFGISKQRVQQILK